MLGHYNFTLGYRAYLERVQASATALLDAVNAAQVQQEHEQQQQVEEHEEQVNEHEEQVNAQSQRRQRRRRRRERKQKSMWVRSWLLRRDDYSAYYKLLREMEDEDVSSYKNFLRMDPVMFRELVDRVGPRIRRQYTNMRMPLEPG